MKVFFQTQGAISRTTGLIPGVCILIFASVYVDSKYGTGNENLNFENFGQILKTSCHLHSAPTWRGLSSVGLTLWSEFLGASYLLQNANFCNNTYILFSDHN